MGTKFFPLGDRWKRSVEWVRVAFGIAMLGVVLLGSAGPSTVSILLLGAFLAWSLWLAVRPPARGPLALLALFADTVFFLLVANHASFGAAWLASFLFLFVAAEAVAFFGPREVATVAMVSLSFCIVKLSLRPDAELQSLTRAAAIAGLLALGFSLYKRRLEERIAHMNAQVAGFHEKAVRAAEAERHRIAADFHDGPLQSYISMQMRLEILRKLLERDRDAGMQDLQQLQSIALNQVRDLRTFLRDLRGPVEVDESNLFVSARRLAESFQKDSGIPVTFVGADTPLAVSPETAGELLQILREALNNVRKHSRATRVAIAIERDGNHIEVSVDDNGSGFPFSGAYTLEDLEMLRMGPFSIMRRVRALNADLTIDSQPGRGAGLKVRVAL